MRSSLAKLKQLTLNEFDDLAVALERLGRRDEALTVLASKAERLAVEPDPEHQYRYHANLGTVLAHAGRFKTAIAELEKAINLNPEAHFGRERYQIDLIRYLAATQKDTTLWSRHNFLSWSGHSVMEVYHGRMSFTEEFEPRIKDSFEDAFQGVTGMLRFGGLEGPELYRALGDLCRREQHLNLAWRFYLSALEKGHPASEQIEVAVAAIEDHWREANFLRNAPTRTQFRQTQQNARRWVEAFQAVEADMLASNQKVDLKAALAEADRLVPEGETSSTWPFWLGLIGVILGLVWLKRYRAKLLSLGVCDDALNPDSFEHDFLLHGWGLWSTPRVQRQELLRLLTKEFLYLPSAPSVLSILACSLGPNCELSLTSGRISRGAELTLQSEYGDSIALALQTDGLIAAHVYSPAEVWLGLDFLALDKTGNTLGVGIVESVEGPSRKSL